MLVHPHTTTRANSDAEKEAPDIALCLLRLTNALVGPTDARFHTAFAFTHFETSRYGRRRGDSPALNEAMSEEKRKAWGTSYNGSRSVWQEAEDFWHAVGWSFNCSVLHPAQWKHWQIWLQFMCQVLEDDWIEREIKYNQGKEKQAWELLGTDISQSVECLEQENSKGKKGRVRKKEPKNDDLGIFRESLIFQYITSNSTYGRDRRIMRAIFADGKPKSAEFRAIFKDEIKPTNSKKSPPNSKKRAGFDIDKGEYGDYQNDSDETYAASGNGTNSASPFPQGRTIRRSKRTRRGTRNITDGATDPETEIPNTHHNSAISSLGGYNSLALRQQLLGLLTKVSATLPTDFIPLDDLYHMFAENIRDLPLPVFQHITTPSLLPGLGPEEHSSLCLVLFYVMRESSALTTDATCLTSSKLEKFFLPYMAASPSVANNAKISMLLEAMMTLLYNEKMLSATPALKNAVRAGIERRHSVLRDHTTVESAYLRESSFRMQFMVDHILP